MKYPLPFGYQQWQDWANELIPPLESPLPGEEDYFRHEKSLAVTGDVTVKRTDYCLLVDTTSGSVTVTIPPSKSDGWECEIVKVSAVNRVIIIPSGTDTLVGETSVEVYDQWTALKFRAVAGGFVLV